MSFFPGLRQDVSNDVLKQLLEQMQTLYRGRPFTKAVPFQRTLPAAGESIEIWVPQNAMFELVVGQMISDTPDVEVTFCDTRIEQPFMFLIPSNTEYTFFRLEPGYRSTPTYAGARLLLIDPSGSGAVVKGTLYGYEVTPEGYYR